MYTYCLRLVRDEDVAKDITQDTFMRVNQGLNNLRNGTVLRVWIFTIARNLALNAVTRTRTSESSVEELMSQDDNPYEAIQHQEEVKTISSAIDCLIPDLREVAVLREYEALSYREIAEVVGISEANVKVRLHRARKALATLLHDEFSKERR